MDPTPRVDRISKDYKQEYPNIEVGSRKVLKQEPETKKKKNIENVKLNEEVIYPLFASQPRNVAQNLFLCLLSRFFIFLLYFGESDSFQLLESVLLEVGYQLHVIILRIVRLQISITIFKF